MKIIYTGKSSPPATQQKSSTARWWEIKSIRRCFYFLGQRWSIVLMRGSVLLLIVLIKWWRVISISRLSMFSKLISSNRSFSRCRSWWRIVFLGSFGCLLRGPLKNCWRIALTSRPKYRKSLLGTICGWLNLYRWRVWGQLHSDARLFLLNHCRNIWPLAGNNSNQK